ncbi:hypothetical protein IU487_22255 [Nocardia puris]|uniref:hypothetical protein n=1 Tax=Nocardia puris TaxID=208602 RepID=UPI001893BED5|nr:hypothetical protein [Nocardia puris]MBF6213743.1 hypothetical protein [Nocardia puris]
MSNPEQRVLDEIDALVDWQIEQGKQRGDNRPEIVGPDLEQFNEGVRALVAAAPAIGEAVNRSLEPIRRAAAEFMAAAQSGAIQLPRIGPSRGDSSSLV